MAMLLERLQHPNMPFTERVLATDLVERETLRRL
jgi:hypothetical protein